MKKTFLTLAAFALLSTAANAQSITCLTGSVYGGPFADGPRCFVNEANKGSVDNFIPAPAAAPVTDPVVTDPVVTEVPSTPLTPATPLPGVYVGNVAGTPYAGTAPGPVSVTIASDYTLPNGSVIPAGSYTGFVAPNGDFVVKKN